MASSLVNRLTIELDKEDSSQGIPLLPFVNGLMSVLHGAHSLTQLKTHFDMDEEDSSTLDILVDKITADVNGQPATLADKMLRVHRLQAVLQYWEMRRRRPIAAYDSPDDVQSWLLQLDQGPA